MARHGCHAMHHQLSAAGMPDASVWLVDCCSGPVAGDAEPFAFLLMQEALYGARQVGNHAVYLKWYPWRWLS